MKGSVLFINELKSVLLATMSDQIKLGMKIFLKSETSRLVRETSLISDTFYINTLAVEMDGLCIVLLVR